MYNSFSQINRNTSNWEKLPLDILVRIFGYLSPNDRQEAANSCKTWNTAFNCPLLWRSLVCVFSSRHRRRPRKYACAENTNCIPIVKHCAPWLKTLIIKWFPKVLGSGRATRNLEIFLQSVAEIRDCIHLKELYLRGKDWSSFEDEEDTFEELTFSLARFLRSQMNLQIFLMEWYLPVLKGALVLDGLSIHTANTLKILWIENAVHHDRLRVSRFLSKYLLSYNQLQTLALAYEDLDEQNLLLTVKNNKETLKVLKILLHDDFQDVADWDFDALPGEFWRKLTDTIPELRVIYDIVDSTQNPDFLPKAVPEELPLTYFAYRGLEFGDDIFQHLENFLETLEVLILHFEDDGPGVISDALIDFVKSASKLRFLRVDGICSMKMILELGDYWFRERRNAGLGLDFKVYNLTSEDIIRLREESYINIRLP